MTEGPRRIATLGLACALLLSTGASAVTPLSAQESLLAASDLFSAAPDDFRTTLEIGKPGATGGARMELFRHGPALALVRFLDEKDAGKFLLRRDDRQYFLSPRSARPVLLSANHRIQGAAIHELLGLDLVRDYSIEKFHEEAGLAIFDLVAIVPAAAAPRIRWVVNAQSRLPVRADLQSASAKVLRVLEFKEWRDSKRRVPARLVVKDLIAGGSPIEVRFESFRAVTLAPALFDLDDGGAREKLLSETVPRQPASSPSP